jgi:hypothetical protein
MNDSSPIHNRERDQAPRIVRRSAANDELDYASLRAEGIALCQKLSGKVWSDYNLSDPGVTLLESLCFALTELPFLANAKVVDHLCDSGGRLDLERYGLLGPWDALTTRPINREDYRLALLDRVENVDGLTIRRKDNELNGLVEITFQCDACTASDLSATATALRKAYYSLRNLGEDLATAPVSEGFRECFLKGDFVLSGPRDSIEVLEECFLVVSELIAQRPLRTLLSLRIREAEAKGESLAECIEGPRLTRGWVSRTDSDNSGDDVVFFSDVARRMLDIDGVSEVRNLALIPVDGISEFSSSSLPLRNRDGRLRLRWPSEPAHLAGIGLYHRTLKVEVPTERLIRRLDNLRVTKGRCANVDSDREGVKTQALDNSLELPTGVPPSRENYYPAFKHLPPQFQSLLAKVNHAVTDAERNRLIGYFALLEQPIANAIAQSQYLCELFATDTKPTQSYGWMVLDNDQVPNIEQIYLVSKEFNFKPTKIPECIRKEVFEQFDEGLARRNKVLDLQLALYGESGPQKRLQGFGAYFDIEQWHKHLFELKRQFIKSILKLTAERAGAIDYSQPSFGNPENTSACQLRLSLLLGFKDGFCRALCEAWLNLGLRVAGNERFIERRGAIPDRTREPAASVVRAEVNLPNELGWLSTYVPLMRRPTLPLPFLRCAVHAERYKIAENDGTDELWLGPDDGEHGSFWLVTDTAKLTRAAADQGTITPSIDEVIERLRSFACHLMLASEGLHLIENILLRPSSDLITPGQEVPKDFYENRLTIVLPRWTTRGADENFRRFTEECVEDNTPAHLLATCLWLDLEELVVVEDMWRAWLSAKQTACNAPADGKTLILLEKISAALRRRLASLITSQGLRKDEEKRRGTFL